MDDLRAQWDFKDCGWGIHKWIYMEDDHVPFDISHGTIIIDGVDEI